MNKTIKIIIALLLVSNLMLIAFLYLGKPKNNHGNPPMEMIIEQLDFDKTQKDEFKKLMDSHRNEIQTIHKKITSIKNEIYRELKNDNPMLNDSLLKKFVSGVKEIETLHFNHFLDIKNLSSNSQKEKFNEMADELGTIFQPSKGPKNKRHDK